MPAHSVEDRIRDITDQLVSDITRVIRSAALGAVQEAMARTEEPPRVQATRRVVSKPVAPRKRKRSLPAVELVPAARAARKPRRKVVSKPVTRKKKRSLPVVELIPVARAAKKPPPVVRKKRTVTPPSAPIGRPDLDPEAIVAHIAAHPGQRIEGIVEALGADAGDSRRALRALKAEGRVHTTGKARGTTYRVTRAAEVVIDDEQEALRALGLIPATSDATEEEPEPAGV